MNIPDLAMSAVFDNLAGALTRRTANGCGKRALSERCHLMKASFLERKKIIFSKQKYFRLNYVEFAALELA